eukprot:3157810-Pyramimonas_sp.AAC.1
MPVSSPTTSHLPHPRLSSTPTPAPCTHTPAAHLRHSPPPVCEFTPLAPEIAPRWALGYT